MIALIGQRSMFSYLPRPLVRPQIPENVIGSRDSQDRIGTFILTCFVVWFVWHMMKKSKAKKEGKSSGSGSSGSRSSGPSKRRWPGLTFPSRLTAKLPFLRNRGEWQDLGGSQVADIPPPGFKGAGMASGQRANEYYGQEKAYRQPSMDQALRLPSMHLNGPAILDTQFLNSVPMADSNSPSQSHQAAPSFSSTDAAQFGGPLLMRDPNGTLRSYMPVVVYDQPELSRQPSEAFDPARRQTNRASELSSLSSGFGDGDMIVPAQMIKPPPPASTNLRQSTNLVGRLSWASQSRRDTVYTQSSEDQPPRFRTVDSWVNQQTGRIKRVQQRERDQQDAPPVPTLPGQPGVPGIHNPPAEVSFNMMMPDDEVPRRVEDTMAMRS